MTHSFKYAAAAFVLTLTLMPATSAFASSDTVTKEEMASGEYQAVNAWMECLHEAIIALAGQHEPAQVVTEAVYGSCGAEERALRKASGQTMAYMAEFKADVMTPKILGQVMGLRAAASKMRE